MLLSFKAVFRADETQLKLSWNQVQTAKALLNLLGLWHDSAHTKKCQMHVLFLLFHSDQGGPDQKGNFLITKKNWYHLNHLPIRASVLLLLEISKTAMKKLHMNTLPLVIQIFRNQTEQCLPICVLRALIPLNAPQKSLPGIKYN